MQQIAMGRIDIDDVEAGLAGALGGIAMPAPDVADVLLVDAARLHGIGARGDADEIQRWLAGGEAGDVIAADPELAAGERPLAMHRLGHQPLGADIFIVPEPGIGIGRVVGARMDRAIFGVHHGPAALGLHAAHGGQGTGQGPAHAGAMRHLIEAVACRQRPDAHRLEQDVVTRIAQCIAPPLLEAGA